MMTTPYGFGTTLAVSYEEAIPHVKEALKAEGFGVLTEIDVRRTMREKLGAEMEPYIILGACNPQLAHRALEQEPDIGLLLPCNVIVRSEGRGSRVEIVDPQAMLGIVNNEELNVVANKAKQRLQRVVASLSTANHKVFPSLTRSTRKDKLGLGGESSCEDPNPLIQLH